MLLIIILVVMTHWCVLMYKLPPFPCHYDIRRAVNLDRVGSRHARYLLITLARTLCADQSLLIGSQHRYCYLGVLIIC